MGKISPVSIKYNIVANLQLTGMVERPDVIGAVFGQTEGLLGPDLELRELQKAGRIGRIDVNIKTNKGKTEGEVIIPSSLSKSETALVAASLETIDRVGPADAKIKVNMIKDIRESKRDYIMDRAKELLGGMLEEVPTTGEMTTQISDSMKAQGIVEYKGLPAGPDVESSDRIVVVEGRADVLKLLKCGIKNVIALDGAKAPPKSITDLSRDKELTLFVDGDRGGELITKNLSRLAKIAYTARAPDGKEVEELTQKEVIKALRSKEKWEGPAPRMTKLRARSTSRSTSTSRTRTPSRTTRASTRTSTRAPSRPRISTKDKDVLKGMSEDLIGSRGAFILDDSLNVLGRVPIKELGDTIGNISETVFALVMDGPVSADLDELAYKKRVKYIVAKTKPARKTKVNVMTAKDV